MTLTHHWLKPLNQQHQLTRWLLITSLITGGTGLTIGIIGTVARIPSAILIGYGLAGPTALVATGSTWASREIRNRLATATKDQTAIDAQIKQAWASGHEAGQTEAINNIEQQHSPQPEHLQTIKQLEANLSNTQAQLTQTQSQLTTETQNHDTELQQRDARIIDLKTQLQQSQQEHQKLDTLKHQLETQAQHLETQKENQHHRELTLARGESQIHLLQHQLNERDQRQNALEQQIKQLTEEYSQALIAEHTEGFNQGIQQTTAQYSLDLEKAHATIAKLQARLDKLNAYESQNRALPTLTRLIGKLMKPAFITAGQGAGKALHSAELCRIWSQGAESACVFVLDISEGGSDASSWTRMGIPVTDDPDLFIQVMGTITAKLSDTRSCLPWRNNPDEYREAPPIVLIIDEALTSFDGQSNGKIQAVIDGLAAIESRGSKRKVFCVACSTDDQIQNISATSSKGKAMKLWNTGRLRNYYRLYLNDALLHRATDDELKSNKGLGEYLTTYGGSHFIAALESFNGKGKHLAPFKHISHHSHLLNETKPSYAPALNLTCPDWFPNAARALFPQSTTAPTPQADVEHHQNATATPQQNPEAMQSLPCGDPPQEQAPSTPAAVECPHCHTIGQHRVHSRDRQTRQVKRWKCKNRGCLKTFKALSVLLN